MYFRRRSPISGTIGEAIAQRFLEQQGYRIVARNYRCPGGELDLVAWDGTTLAFVEVKARRCTDVLRAFEAIGARKQRRIFHAAESFLAARGLRPAETRFDVVVVLGEGEDARCELLRNAFQAFR